MMQKIMIRHYGLETDPVVSHKASQHGQNDAYPVALFNYLASKAPQIGNLG